MLRYNTQYDISLKKFKKITTSTEQTCLMQSQNKYRAGKFWQGMNKYTKPALSWTEPACLNIANK